jgi:voltage-gated potassium channel Kch
VAIEHSQEQVEFVRRFGNVVFYGDPAHAELLRSAGAARVKVFVIAIDDAESSLRTVRVVRRHYPDAAVFARARNRRHAWELMDLGAQVVRETFHSSLVMGERVLVALGAEKEAAARDAQRFREHDEALLRSQYLVHDDEGALLQSAQEARRELEELFGADRGEGVLGGLVPRDGEERKGPDRAADSGST